MKSTKAEPTVQSEKRIDNLDALRGVAALSVVLLHLFSTLRDTRLPDLYVVDGFFQFADKTPIGAFWAGSQAVYLFFILSGFALTSMLDNFKHGYMSYCVRRIVRLWAPCAVSLVLALIVIWIVRPVPNDLLGAWHSHLVPEKITKSDILDNFLLIGEFDSTKINFVVWSLVHEIRISLIFPALLLLARRAPPTVVIAVSLLISVLTLYLRTKGYISDNKTSFFSSFIYQVFFVVGILLHDHYHQLLRISSKVSEVNRFVLFAIGIVIYANPMGTLYGAGLLGGVIIVVCSITPGVAYRLLGSKSMLWLGKISYSLYLIHSVFIVNVFSGLSSTKEMVVAASLFIPVTLLASAIFYNYVEFPLNRVGRNLSMSISGLERRKYRLKR